MSLKLFLSGCCILLMGSCSGQPGKHPSLSVADRFEKNYNKANYDSIFAMFSPEMKAALPNDQTLQFFTGLNAQAGQILKKEFSKKDHSYSVYKTTFEKGVFAVNISVDNNSKINGLFIEPFVADTLSTMERNKTKLKLPFNEEWTVVWGGDTKEQNYHVEHRAQKNAFDMVITGSNGKSYKTNGENNEDYYAFGKDIVAPCNGEVVLVVDGIKDNRPGQLNPIYIPGNTVIIKTENNEFLFLAHFKQHTIAVKQGQPVNQGQFLGLCGNSGNSSEPHLHFHIQNAENMNISTGIKCYFENLQVNGKQVSDYSPVQKDRISN